MDKIILKKQRLSNLALLLAAFIWGTAFVAQSVGMEHVGPFTFLWVRSFIGAVALLPVIYIRHKCKKRADNNKQSNKKVLLAGGLWCGLALCIASNLQQVGIQYTSVGNAGFITSMYMLIVPVFSIFLGKKVKSKIWICITIAAIGMYLLSISENLSISKGDVIIAGCAVFYAIQIMVVDYYAPKVDGVQLSCLQFLITGIITMFLAVIFENPDIVNILRAAVPILYAGVFSSGVAFTLQIIAQKYAEPTIATLFMSMESVFSMLGGIVVLQQIPTTREAAGCVLVFIAVVASQIDFKTLFDIKNKGFTEGKNDF